MVDDNDIYGRLCTFQLEAKLLLQCSEYRRTRVRGVIG